MVRRRCSELIVLCSLLKILVSASVTKILVGINVLRDEGATAICNALQESKVTRVQELDLSENDIGPDGAKAVAAMAAVVGSLTKILVNNNFLGGKGTIMLCDALRESKVSKVQELHLGSNGIGRDGAKAIAALCAARSAVTKMLVPDNRLRDEGTTILCDALRESTVSKVQELDLINNQIGPNGAKAIAVVSQLLHVGPCDLPNATTDTASDAEVRFKMQSHFMDELKRAEKTKVARSAIGAPSPRPFPLPCTQCMTARDVLCLPILGLCSQRPLGGV